MTSRYIFVVVVVLRVCDRAMLGNGNRKGGESLHSKVGTHGKAWVAGPRELLLYLGFMIDPFLFEPPRTLTSPTCSF